MKPKITPTRQERVMRDEDFIVSKTDTSGKITYANRIFIEFSGYREADLLGKQHNIIRHPDMPRAVFKLLWETITAEREFFGYVKNMANDGSFYWTFANVTATHNPRGELVGFYSVRRKPSPSAIQSLEPLYREMLTAERDAGSKAAIDISRRLLEDHYRSQGTSYEEFILSL